MERKYLIGAIIWTVLITFLSLKSESPVSVSIKIPHVDKIVHFVFYFVFVFLWSKATETKQQLNLFTIVLIAIIYGIIIEALQGLVTETRNADILDIVANSIGALLAMLLLRGFKNKTLKKL